MNYTLSELLTAIRASNSAQVEIILNSETIKFNNKISRLIFLSCIKCNNNETIKILKLLLKNYRISYDGYILSYIIRKIHHTNKAIYLKLILKYKNTCYKEIIYDIINEDNYKNSKKENKKLCIKLLLILTSKFKTLEDYNGIIPYTITDYFYYNYPDDIMSKMFSDSIKITNILIDNKLIPYDYHMYEYFAIEDYQKPIKAFLSKDTGNVYNPYNVLLDDVVERYDYIFFKYIIQNELINFDSKFHIVYKYLRIDRWQNSLYDFYCCSISILYGLIARYYNIMRLYNEFEDEKEFQDITEFNNLKKMICLLIDSGVDINRRNEKGFCIEHFINCVVINSWAYEYYDETTIMMFLDDKRPLVDLLIEKGITIKE